MAKKKINQQSNNGGDDGNNDHYGGKKQKASGVTMVLRMDMHCEGCAEKIVRAVHTLDGVESVRIGDNELNKLTVIGNVDPIKLRQKVEEKTKKKVEVISQATKKPNHGENTTQSGGKDNKKKQQKPPEQDQKSQNAKTVGKKDEKKPKELPVTTAVLKVPLHCQGCVRRIHKLVEKTKGYMDMSLDKKKELVTVKGAIDMKVLAEALQHKLKRVVEIVPSKKGSGGGGGGENEKKKGGGGIHEDALGKGRGEKKGGSGGGRGGGGGGGEGNDGEGKIETYFNKTEGYGGYPYPRYVYGSGYVDDVHAPQLFSDENPNACMVM